MKTLAFPRSRDGSLIALMAAAAAAVVALAPSTGDAAPPTTTYSVNVNLDDLNLTNEAGIRALYGRIQNAAEKACGPEDRDHKLRRLREQCVNDAVARAVAELNRPLLTAMHNRASSNRGP